MRWWWALAEWIAQWRWSRADKAERKWRDRATRLREKQEQKNQGDLFAEPWQ